MLTHRGTPPETILGPVDALKLRSCATLFEAAGTDPVFRGILDAFYAGERCPLTVAELRHLSRTAAGRDARTK